MTLPSCQGFFLNFQCVLKQCTEVQLFLCSPGPSFCDLGERVPSRYVEDGFDRVVCA